jgi:hypothetical protein
MQPATWMTNPSWFLVTGLPWPEDQAAAEVAEAAFAIAPSVTQTVRPMGRDGNPVPLGRDLSLMLDAGARCAAALGKKVIFLSDVTRWLAGLGLSWERIGVDFPAAQNELEHQSPGLFLAVTPRTYTILCSTTGNLTIRHTSGSTTQVPPAERERVRARFEAALDADWPHYIAKALASAQPAA